MEDLLTLNIFALSLPLALFSAGLFGSLIVMPAYFNRHARPGPDTAGRRPPP